MAANCNFLSSMLYEAVVVLCIITTGLVGCSYKIPARQGNYDKAIEDGKKNIGYVSDFIRLYPDSKNFFSYYTGVIGPPQWNAKAGLHERYSLTMQLPVTFDETRTKIVGFGDPKFLLREIDSIVRSPGQNTHIRSGGGVSNVFGKQEWARIVASKGDLTTLGVTIVKDRPVPGFKEEWAETPGGF